MKVKYKFQSLDEHNKIVGNKNKIYEVEIKHGKKPNLINCIEARLFEVMNDNIDSFTGVRDILTYAQELALKATHFEIVKVVVEDETEVAL